MCYLLNCIIYALICNIYFTVKMLNFFMKSAVISKFECYIYVHMDDLITRINLNLNNAK